MGSMTVLWEQTWWGGLVIAGALALGGLCTLGFCAGIAWLGYHWND